MTTNSAAMQLAPPFTVRLLDTSTANHVQVDTQPPETGDAQAQTHSRMTDDELLSLLPSSYRTGEKGFNVTAANDDVMACIRKELDLQRLHVIFLQLWSVGRPIPPRPLHYQLLVAREILITEQMDLHLVWTTGRIFIKPIPRYLLEPQFWTRYLDSDDPCACFPSVNAADASAKVASVKKRSKDPAPCEGGLRRCALGFLFSYAALIAHESDFQIAQKRHLIPAEVQWPRWRTFIKELETHNIYDLIDDRFKYGELRLSRLNKIYLGRMSFEGYLSRFNQYGSFLEYNFTWLASTTVFVAIVLTAMQVGSSTDGLRDEPSFEMAAYGFTVFAILGPIVAGMIIVLAFFVLFIINWIIAVKFWRKRAREVGMSHLATQP